MATFANIQKKIAVKIKTLTLAAKEKERIFSRGKENELIKQQEFIEKRLGERFKKPRIRHSDRRNRKQVEIIQGNGETKCDRTGRQKNDEDAAVYEEERR